MDARFAEHVQRARVYTARGKTFVTRSRNPFEAVLFGLAALVFVAVAIVLILPFVLIAAAAALGAVAYVNLRRAIGRLGKPNGHLGPVRTDGRENVRVVGRDANAGASRDA